jgi:O-acetyl-ADP-ribose deacetylase (regulator of RNase III)
MIEYVKGDIWETKAEAIVIPVNIVGVMGKGLALQCKENYPQAYTRYYADCKNGHLQIGRTCLYTINRQCLIMLPTKSHWSHPSQYGYIEAGIKSLIENNHYWELASIAFPKLGCGEGELDWSSVKEIMSTLLKDCYFGSIIYV